MAVHNKINRKKFLAASALTLVTALIASPGVAKADDEHAWVLQNGGGSFSTDVSMPNTTTITQTTDRAIGIGNTSIAGNQTVNILQNGAGSLFVAKDNTGNATALLGRLNANGGVIVLNENGVIFGKDAVINVGSIVASTGSIENEKEFLEGSSKLQLTHFGNAAIVNEGTINVSGAGLAAFVAPTVINNGIIQAKLGKVALGAGGEKATVDLYGDGLIELTLGDSKAAAKIENAGSIEGKTVLMTAAAAKDVVDTVINMSGVIKASSVTEAGGKIVLNGGSSGKVVVSGTVEANGATKGGSVSVKGDDVFVSGIIHADGALDGGNVEIIGDKRTYFTGYISTLGRNGFVETSGDLLGIHGSVVTGENGQWLLDPTDIRIVDGTGNGGTFNPDDSADDSWYWLGADYIINALNAGTSVTIQTSVNGTRAGDIVVDAAIAKTSGADASLTLNAINDIYVNQQISSTNGKLNVNLNAGVGVTGADADVYVHNNVLTNGGDVKITALDDIDVTGNAVIRTGVAGGTSGNVTLDAQGLGGAGNPSYVWMTTGGKIDTAVDIGGTAAGNVTINTENFHLADAGTHIYSGTGDLTVNNTGVFEATAGSLVASGAGKISVNQNVGTTYAGATSSIQNAVDALSNSGSGLKTVTVGDGTYNENVTLSASNVALKSKNGRDATTINGQQSGFEQGAVYLTAGTNNVQVGAIGHGFTINGLDGNGASEKAAIYLQGNHDGVTIAGNNAVAQGDEALLSEYAGVINNLTIDNNIFSGKTFTGTNPSGVGSSTQFNVGNNVPRQLVVIGGGAGGGNTSNVTFTNNDLTGTTGGISSDDGVSNQGNFTATIDSKNATITGNTFEGTTTGNGSLRVRGTNTLVSGNTFKAAGLSGSAVHVVAAESVNGATSQADISHLAATNTFIGNATVSTDQIGTTDIIGRTIQSAVDVSNSGASVYVNSGTYNESVNVNKSVSLYGANAGVNPITDARVAESVINGVTDPAINITANSVTVDGFTVHNAGKDAIDMVNAGGAVIQNNIISDASFGIVAYGGTPTRSIIQNNKISDIDNHGIYIGENQYATITGNNLSDVNVGITTENFYTAAADNAVTVISNNTISAKSIGIRNNLSYGTQSGFQISNNIITAEDPSNVRRWTGIDVISQMGGVGTLFQGNNIDGSAVNAARQTAGYELTNMTNANRAVIDGGTVKNVDVGVWATDGSFYTGAVTDLLIKNVNFKDINEEAILAEDTTDASNNPALSVNNTTTHITIGNNTYTNTNHDVALAGAASVALAAGNAGFNDVIVKAAGPAHYVGSPSGTTATPLTTGNASINAGIAIVATNGAVNVDAGTFTEQVNISKNLNLIGSGIGSTILQSPTTLAQTGFSPNAAANYAILYVHDAANVNVSGLTIDGTNNTQDAFFNDTHRFIGALYANAGGNFSNNRITGVSSANANRTGFGFLGFANTADTTLNIENNTIDGFQTFGIALANIKLHATVSGNTVIGDKDNVASLQTGLLVNTDAHVNANHNNISATDTGISVSGASDNTFADNTLLSVHNGIAVSDSINTQLTGNNMTGNTDTGISVVNSAGTVINGGTINHFQTGIDVSGSDNVTVKNVTIYDILNGNAINFANSKKAQITSNAIGYTTLAATTPAGSENIHGDGVYVTGGDGVVIKGNKIVNTKSMGDANGSGIQVVNTNGATIGGSAAGEANTINNSNWDGIRLQSDSNVTVTGNIIDGTARVNIWGGNVNTASILNNTVTNDNLAGYGSIHADGGSSWTVTGNTVDNGDYGIFLNGAGGTNLISTNYVGTTGNATLTADGIRAINTAGLTISGNSVGNVLFNGDSIHVEGSNGVKILGNYAYNALGTGIFLKTSDTATISGNYIEGYFTTAGIDIVDSDGVNVLGNFLGQVSYPGYNGLVGEGIVVEGGSDNAKVDGNNIRLATTSTGSGVHVVGGVGQAVSNNTINGGKRGILLDGTGANAQVTGNTVGQTTGNGYNGIELSNTGTATVSGNHIYNAGWDNINVNGGNAFITVSGNDVHNAIGASGIVVYGHNGGGLIDNNTVENSARLGIYDGFSNGVTISNNTVTNSGTANITEFLDGIFVEQANNVIIDNNKVNTTKGGGIRVGGVGNAAAAATTGIVVKNNKIANTGANGLAVIDSKHASISGNKVGYLADGTTSAGADNIHGDGILVVNSDGAVIKTNTVTETHSATAAKGSGISVVDSDSVMIGGLAAADGNTVSNADWDGIRVTTDTGTSNLDTMKNNTVTNTARVGVYSAHATNLLIDSNIVDGATSAIGIPYGAIASDWGSNITISNNTVKNSTDGILMYSVTGTNKIDSNKIDAVSNAGIYANSVAGLTVNKNKVGQHVASATGVIGGDGIDVLDSAAAQITGNTVTASGVGIFLDPSNGSFITGNTVTGGTTGIYSLNNSNVTIGGNTAALANTVTGASADGIKVEGGTGNKVIGNTVNTSGHDGIEALNTGKVTITSNKIDGAGYIGIELNNAGGIDSANQSVVSGNTAKNALDGIDVFSSNFVTVGGSLKNTISGMTYDGIEVDGSNNVLVDNNDISSVGDNGLEAYNNLGLVIKRNTIKTTGNDGIHVDTAAGVIIGGTSTSDANKVGTTGVANNIGGDGIHVENSGSAKILNNLIGNAKDDGIFLDPSDYSVIAGNTVTAVGGNGIESSGNSHVMIGGTTDADRNFITNTGANGILVSGGTDNTLNRNVINTTGSNGIYINASLNANVIDNRVGTKWNPPITIPFIGTIPGFYTQVSDSIHGDGVLVTASNNAVITGNTVNGTDANGIHVEGSNDIAIGGTTATLGNKITEADANGIFVNGGTSALVQYNQILGGNLNGKAGAGLDGIRVVSNDGVEILNNTVAAGQGFGLLNGGNGANQNGIFLLGSDNAVIDQNTVYGDILGTGVGAVGDGIHVENSNLLTVGGLAPVLNGNKIVSTGGDGINIDGSVGLLVLNNIIGVPAVAGMGVAGDGVHMNNTLGSLVAGNIITHTGGDGIEFTDGGLSAIGLNMITDAGDDGIRISDAALMLVGLNQITGTVNDGIGLTNTHLALIMDNTINNAGKDGINARLFTNSLVTGNHIKTTGDDGIDIGFAWNTDITDNTIDNTAANGVQLFAALKSTISDNTITNAKGDGIDVAFAYDLDVTGNFVDKVGVNGIEASYVANANINNNKVGLNGNVGGNGIDVRNSAFVNIAANDIGTNVVSNGIFVDPSFNITIDNNDVNGAGADGIHAADTTNLIISNNRVNDSGDDGVEVRNSNNVQFLTNIVKNSGNRGLYVSGQDNGSVVLKGNTFTDNVIGAEFESGIIDLRALGADANAFNGGNVGMFFDPTKVGDPLKLVLKDDTIGETKFNGQTTFYVQLANGAFFAPGTPTILDGYRATYDGFRPDTVPFLTVAQYNAIEAKIYHYRDDPTLGLFFFGLVPELDQKDLLKEFGEFNGASGKFRVTILGLPRISGTSGSFAGGGNIANLLASITPAAGGNDNGKPKTGIDVANIEPAAGPDTTPAATNDNAVGDTACWSQAVAKASQGSAVDYSFGGSMEEAIAQTASCGSGTAF